MWAPGRVQGSFGQGWTCALRIKGHTLALFLSPGRPKTKSSPHGGQQAEGVARGAFLQALACDDCKALWDPVISGLPGLLFGSALGTKAETIRCSVAGTGRAMPSWACPCLRCLRQAGTRSRMRKKQSQTGPRSPSGRRLVCPALGVGTTPNAGRCRVKALALRPD